MPTAIRLTTMPGKIRKGTPRQCPRAGSVRRLARPRRHHDPQARREVAPAVRAFGERIRAEHPEASFKILVSVRKGQRKPPGYDAAENAGEFKDRAFMHVETEDGQPVSITALTAAAS